MISKQWQQGLSFIQSNKDASFSFLFYGFGLLGMLLSDLYVSSNFSTSATAEWAFFKSTILIVSTICLLGFDQLFVRDQTLIKRYFKSFLGYCAIIISTVVLIIFFIKDYSYTKVGLLGLAIFLMAIQNYISAASRGNYRLWKAQFSANFWKLLIFITILTIPNIDTIHYFIVVLVFTVSTGLLLGGFKKVSDQFASKEYLDTKTARLMGISFLLHNLTLVVAIYGEQFLINLFGAEVASSHLFKYVAVFTPIALSLNGFLGFYLGPKIRIKNTMDLNGYKKFGIRIFLFSIGVVTVSFVFGLIYMRTILDIGWQELDYWIISCLFVITMVRGLYIATSVCLGVFGTKKFLQKAASYTWLATIGYLLGIVAILFIYKGVVAAELICLATLINWILRLAVSNTFTIKTFKTRVIG
ncbi:hypothetical protein [Dokdonia sp.]|uniref:hypothetical protein n=1 Tax=Dokdonia sp. TaxID=2024995 RepID=UPI003264D985